MEAIAMMHTSFRVASFCILALLLVSCMGAPETAPTAAVDQPKTAVAFSTAVPSPVVRATSDTQDSLKTAESYYNAGFAWYQQGDYRQAISSLSKAIKTV